MKSKACLLILFLAPIAYADEPCVQPDLHAAAMHVKTIQTRLLAFKLQSEQDESVPVPLQAEIRAFKDSLSLFADAKLQCAPAIADPKLIESGLANLLEANKPEKNEVYDPKKPPQLDHIYGDWITVKVTAPANPPNILLVEFGFGIACGSDSVLLIFERQHGRWGQRMRWQSGGYDEVSGAFGDFLQYQIVQQRNSATWLLAVAHGEPWCTSRWSGFHLDVLQPPAGSSPQQSLFQLTTGYIRFEIDPTMKLTSDGFQLRLETDSLDNDLMTRPGIFRYRISGKQVTRVQPIALNGRDFVDEWLKSPWSEAGKWSAQARLSNLETTHKKIATLEDPSANETPNFTYGPVRSCSDSKLQFQVELDEGWWVEQQKDWRPGKPTFFQIQEGKNSFTMLSASGQPDQHCTGPDIMPKQ
jgi:hypothetical protein